MDLKSERHSINQCCVPLEARNSQNKMSKERRKIINHIRRLSTIDEMGIRPSIPSVSPELDDSVCLKRSASGKLT